ncbi:unnamed protein product [Symbiodinium natans]|uniref:C2H2-type domain-containing protein n=1 Tax=Symbiodinium natans TaxID=878477 RepID=A0A812RBK8_9DINO|nr:unnamed protein product [Symbiodinium natans]
MADMMALLVARKEELPSDIQALLQQSASANAKDLHRCISAQSNAAKALSQVQEDRETYLLGWQKYIHGLASTVEAQLTEKEQVMLNYQAAEESLQETIEQAREDMLRLAGGEGSKSSEATLMETDGLPGPALEDQAAIKAAELRQKEQALLQSLKVVKDDADQAATRKRKELSRTPRRSKQRDGISVSSGEEEAKEAGSLLSQPARPFPQAQSRYLLYHSIQTEIDCQQYWNARPLALHAQYMLEAWSVDQYVVEMDSRVSKHAVKTRSPVDIAYARVAQRGLAGYLQEKEFAGLCHSVQDAELTSCLERRRTMPGTVHFADLGTINRISCEKPSDANGQHSGSEREISGSFAPYVSEGPACRDGGQWDINVGKSLGEARVPLDVPTAGSLSNLTEHVFIPAPLLPVTPDLPLEEKQGSQAQQGAAHPALEGSEAARALDEVLAGCFPLRLRPLPALDRAPSHVRAAVAPCHRPIPDLRQLPIGSELHLFSDGSRSTAGSGWAVVVTSWVPDRGWGIEGCLFARTAQGIFGETVHDSCEAEASAVSAALVWALAAPPAASVFLHYDNEAAGQAATGTWAGHSGHAWNDAADFIAKAALHDDQGQTCINSLSSLLQPKLLPWLWTLPVSAGDLPTAWDLVAGTGLVNVSATQRSDCAFPTGKSHYSKPVAGKLSFLSFNEEAGMYIPALQELLAKQLLHDDFGLVALQETRLPSSSSYTSGAFYVVNSACDEQGQGGCALWFRVDEPLLGSGKPVTPSQVTLLFSSPRLLVCRLTMQGATFLCVCAHAPHSKRPEKERLDWWDLFVKVLGKVCKSGDILLIAADANARLGASHTGVSGSFGAEPLNANGEAWLELLEQFGMCLPATFSHTGPSATWRSPQGFEARLDYIAIPQALSASVEESATLLQYDALTNQDDHRAVSCRLRLQLPGKATHRPKSVRWQLPEEWAEPWSASVACMTRPRWDLSTDQHASALRQGLQDRMAHFHYQAPPTPRRPYVTPEILDLLKERNALRKRLRELRSGGDNVEQSPLLAQFRTLARALRRKLKAAKVSYLTSLAVEFEHKASFRDSKALYRALQPLRAGPGAPSRVRPATQVLTKDGLPCADAGEIADLWSFHFARSEGGKVCTAAELVSDHVSSLQPLAQSAALDFLPTLTEWEGLLRALPRGKAPGPDGLSSSHVRAATAAMARLTYGLTLKVACGAPEPLAWRGGKALPLFKGKGQGTKPGEYRSILVSEVLGKRWHAWLRSSLLATFRERAAPLQCGVTGGHSTGLLSLFLRSFQAQAQSRGFSWGILFVDLRSAFYSVLRQFVTGADCSLDSFQALCGRLGIGVEQFEAIVAALGAVDAKVLDSLQPVLGARVKDVLQSTWFQVQGSEKVVATQAGSRPGDPLADILFGLSVAGAVKQLNETMRDAGLLPSFNTAGVLPGVEPGTSWLEASCMWHDDLAVPFVVDTPAALQGAIAFVARLAHDTFASRGLSVNYDNGKTECVCRAVGKGSRVVTFALKDKPNPTVSFLPDIGTMQQVKIVPEYCHLGSLVAEDCSLLPDIRRRLLLAAASAKPLAKSVFSNPNVPLAVRRVLFRGLVLGRALHGVGAWAGLQVQEMRAWHAGIMRLYRLLLPVKNTASDPWLSDVEVCKQCGLPPPCRLLSLERLRLFGQLHRTTSGPIAAAIEAVAGEPRCWLSDVLDDYSWLCSLRLAPTSVLPKPLPQEVCAFVNQNATVLNRCLSKAGSRAAEAPQPSDLPPARQESQSITCFLCQQTCKGRQGLAAHLALSHHIQARAGWYAVGSSCQACGLNFRTRTRLLRHWRKGKPACMKWVSQHCEAVSDTARAELDRAESLRLRRTKGRGPEDSLPIFAEVGPPPIVLGARETPRVFLDDVM